MPWRGVSLDVPCARCGRRDPANQWGEPCRVCVAETRQRSRRLARIAAPVAALLVAAYVFLTVPAEPAPRFYGMLGVLLTYLLTRRIVTQLGALWFARTPPGQEPSP